MSPALDRLVEALRPLELRRRDVGLLIGTDEHIPHERRVALTPRHVGQLAAALRSLGIDGRIAVVAGAGRLAAEAGGPGFPDAAYAAAGAEVIAEGDLAGGPAWDVVHALKEPTPYEARIPGPFLRIGALHLASRPAGVRDMLARRNFAAILDGGTVGSCSWLLHGGDRTPIVASMSRFAGSVAGRQMVASLEQSGLRGRIVIVGGGIAGQAAIRQVIPVAEELVVVDPWAPTRERLAEWLPSLGCERFRLVEALEDALFDDAVGILFAHRSGARAAEKVSSIDQIRRMRRGAAVVDIAIDQGGSIAHPAVDPEDDAHTARRKCREQLDGYFYYAETNMPREEPREASEMHGDSSLPYLLVLLALVAGHGDAEAATRTLLDRDQRVFREAGEIEDRDLLSCIGQDLRNGIQLAVIDDRVRITDADVAADPALSEWIRAAADDAVA